MKKFTERELDLSNQVLLFLQNHPLISLKGLNDLLGLPSTTLQKSVESERISPKHLFGLIYELAKYGLKIDGYTLEQDEETHSLLLCKNMGPAKIKDVKTQSGSYFEYIQKQDRSLVTDIFDLLD